MGHGMKSVLITFLAHLLSLSACKTSGNVSKVLVNETTGGNNTDAERPDLGPETTGGNNADPNARLRRVAAFVGAKQVPYCIIRGDDVKAMSDDDLAEAFQEAHKAWAEYIATMRINERLVALGGKPLPQQFVRVTDCAQANLMLYAGTNINDDELRRNLRSDRDSVLGGIFKRGTSSLYKAALWIAGEKAAPKPQVSAVGDEAIDRVNYSNAKEVGAILRYFVGRLLGNLPTPGSILERLPEKLLACARNSSDPENAKCVALISSGAISPKATFATVDANGEGTIQGCFLGYGPIDLTLTGGVNYSIGNVWGAKWKSPSQRKRFFERREVFAEADRERLFYEESSIVGFSENGSDGKSIYEDLYLNKDAGHTQLSVRCGATPQIIFTSSTTSCGNWNEAKVKADVATLLRKCN